MSGSFHFLEHTADICLAVRGGSLAELFTAAARGMTEYLFGPEVLAAGDETQEELRLEAPDAESLLVDWLSRLLLLSATRGAACLAVELVECTDRALRARIGFAPAKMQEEIKAVTYHGLKIEQRGGNYEARIVFDI